MAPRLKVFTWSDGFHSWTVAASSRPKALEAWKVEQDLFKTGLAHEAGEGPDREAALADPGKVIKSGLAIDPDDIKPAKADPRRANRTAARKKAADIRARIAALDEQLESDLAPLRDQREQLTARIEALEAKADKARAALHAKLSDKA